jgi:hypothetical protein
MVHHRDTVWRIEFRTDQTRADSAMLPLAYMLESHWEDGVRWLGMLFRKRLSTLELDQVNLRTWPELQNLEGFMKGLFDEAWTVAEEVVRKGELVLGSDIVAVKYPVQSALNFTLALDERYVFGEDDAVKSFTGLYEHLLGFRDALAPRLTASVVRFPTRTSSMRPERADLEIASRAA